MQESAKYLIHADFTANGIVERNDVVGAVFGQTEGLLGDELDLRELQEGSKVGRIDVDVTSEGGQSFGEITIASGLDRVETAILAASLETIERVGPCRASVSVTDLEDVRSAKRRDVVDRATELLAEFEAGSITSHDIVEEVRQRLRVEDVTEYEGLPAGPRVADSDAVIIVEGRSDVLQLLQYGIKNAIAVEGTDVPAAVADLSRERTVTTFLDGDRGGELILKELAQVGTVDYVAFAPAGSSVEDLSRSAVMAALRDKVPYDALDGTGPVAAGSAGEDDADETVTGETDDHAGAAAPDATSPESDPVGSTDGGPVESAETVADGATEAVTTTEPQSTELPSQPSEKTGDPTETTSEASNTTTQTTNTASSATEEGDASSSEGPTTVAAHAQAVIARNTQTVRLLDDDATTLNEGPASDAFDLLREADPVPTTVILDETLPQRILDVAAQRGVQQIVAKREGEFVKQPTAVRVRTIDEL